MKYLLFAVVTNDLLFFLLATNDTMAATKALYEELFITKGYTPKQGPNYQHNAVPNVWLGFHLLSIDSLDEAKETLTTMSIITIGWYDDFLVWEPEDFQNMTFCQWYQDSVWTPPIDVRNTVTKVNDRGTPGTVVENYNNGYMFWTPLEKTQSSCSLDLTYFPFDKQRCELIFGSVSMGNTINLQLDDDDVNMTWYKSNPNWDIVSTAAEKKGTTYMDKRIIFSLEMRRKPSHFLFTLFLPIILLSVLNLFVFALPSGGGEKAGYSITVFLACSVYLTIVQSTLPANSESVSYFSIYLAFQTMQSTVITVVALNLIRLASFDDKKQLTKVLSCIISLTRCCNSMKMTNKMKTNSNHTVSETEHQNRKNESNGFTRNGIVTLECGVTDAETKLSDTQEGPVAIYTWKAVAATLDKLAFAFFASLFLISTVLLFIVLLTRP